MLGGTLEDIEMQQHEQLPVHSRMEGLHELAGP